MEDDFEEQDDLMDDDPAFNYILYEDIARDENKKPVGSGCLGIVLFFLVTCVSLIGIL